jgi:hypothetical protein
LVGLWTIVFVVVVMFMNMNSNVVIRKYLVDRHSNIFMSLMFHGPTSIPHTPSPPLLVPRPSSPRPSSSLYLSIQIWNLISPTALPRYPATVISDAAFENGQELRKHAKSIENNFQIDVYKLHLDNIFSHILNDCTQINISKPKESFTG